MNRTLLKAKEVAQVLGIGRTNVYALLNSGSIEVIRIGKNIRVSEEALQNYLQENTQRIMTDPVLDRKEIII